MEDLRKIALEIAERAKTASNAIARASSTTKNTFLLGAALQVKTSSADLIAANKEDLATAKSKGLSGPLLDRLALDDSRIETMSKSLGEVSRLADPVGEIGGMWTRPNGLKVGRMRIPLGVIAVIYEARPNVTSDAAALCVKAGNAVILRGGSEALHSNRAIVRNLRTALQSAGLPENAIQLVEQTDHALVDELLKLDDHIDLVVPRGGEALIRSVVEKSRIPVVKHYKGVCHVFVDESADLDMALSISLNAKTQRPAVCNAMETLLVHEQVARPFLAMAVPALASRGVEIRGCEKTRAIQNGIQLAREEDWYEEYLALVLAVRVVKDLDEAMAHIRKYGSLHTESIVTRDYGRAERFLREVNSSTVLVNASTRFSDGYELGLGAEVGISTSKIHAFGPMGLEGLTTQKFIVYGSGQLRT